MTLTISYSPSLVSTLFDVLAWYAALQLMSFAVMPLIALALPMAPDRGYGLSKPLGLWLTGFCVWFLGSLGITRVTPAASWAVLLVLTAVSFRLIRKKWGRLAKFVSPIRARCIQVEVLFAGGLLFFIFLGVWHPEIYWGEKPMDFTFLNYFVRLTDLPPDDPWAAGQRMNYYYLGTFFYAVLHKLAGIDTAVGYNLGIATIAAFHLCAGFSLGLMLTKKTWGALVSTAFLMLASNIELIKIINFGEESGRFPAHFDLFWAATRGLVSPYFAEFPLWSILFADFHAHVISLPMTVCLIALAFRFFAMEDDRNSSSHLTHRIFYGVLLGSLFGMNSWDCVVYCLFTFLVLLVKPLGRAGYVEGILQRGKLLLVEGAYIGVPALLAILPFLLTSAPGKSLHFGLVTAPEFNSYLQILGVIGQWLVPAGIMLLLIGWKTYSALSRRKLASAAVLAALAAAAPLLLAGYCRYKGITGTPWGIVGSASGIIFFAVFSFVNGKRDRAELQLGVMLCTGALVMTGTELFFLSDRMNTIFKFYHAIWTLFSLATAALVVRFTALIRAGSHFPDRYILRLGAILAVTPLLFSFVASAINIWIMSTYTRRAEFERPALNGMSYLARLNAREYRALQFLRSRIKGTPTLLEAHGPPYQDFARVTMNTGLPSVLSWDYHVFQRGTPAEEVERRKRDITTIYTTEDPQIAYALMRKYDVQLVMVGELEELAYAGHEKALKKFERYPQLFAPIFNLPGTAIYVPTYSPIIREDIGPLKSLRERGVLQ